MIPYRYGVGGDLGHTPSFEGREAEHKYGVSYTCRWFEPADAFSVHGRRVALALASSGVPTRIESTKIVHNQDVDKELLRTVEPYLEAHIANVSAVIDHALPHGGKPEEILARYLSKSRGSISPEQAEALNRHRIFSTVFEQQKIAIRRARTLARFGAIWVATEKDRKMLAEAGVPEHQIEVIRVPYDPADRLQDMRGTKRIPGPVRFYHIGKWEPRKDQHLIIGAFLSAFGPRDRVVLYLKTSDASQKFGGDITDYYPSSPAKSLQIWLGCPEIKKNGWTVPLVQQRCYLIRGQKPREQLVELHRTGDVIVSLSHGEGYDMPCFEAKLAGNRMICTDSAAKEFATSDDVVLPYKEERKVHPFYAWGDGATWGCIDVSDAARAMRLAYEKVNESGDKDHFLDDSPFAAESVGKVARESVEALLRRLGVNPEWS